MGRDARMNLLNARSEMAALERTAGPMRAHGSIPECPKCKLSSEHVLYQFCTGHEHLSDNPRQCPMDGEHLHRLCPRCQYGWFERCADWVEDEA